VINKFLISLLFNAFTVMLGNLFKF